MPPYYDDDNIDIHVRHRDYSPARPVRYVQRSPPAQRYFPAEAGPNFLGPENRTTLIARTRSRSRSRSYDRRDPNPQQSSAQPIIINNHMRNEYDYSSSDDSYDSESSHERRRHRRKSSRRPRRRSPSSSRSRSRERDRERDRNQLRREDWEAEQARRELEAMRLAADREKSERRLQKEYLDGAELQRAKQELDDIKAREQRAAEEKRIARELEYKRLQEEEEAAEEKKRKAKAAEEAVEKYKMEEAERKAKEAEEAEENEREYRRRMQEDLLKCGISEKDITAILKGEKPPPALPAAPPPPPAAPQDAVARPTYTRMARRHLSIETLRTFHVDFDFDDNPEFVLIKRWVPEWEQDHFWKHTKHVRSKRGKGLMVEEKYHYTDDPKFEWVRKKSHRKRSKSPSLLMYLAGAKPS